jgi:tRNA A37 threonylcarbamoyladenosine dehydratase
VSSDREDAFDARFGGFAQLFSGEAFAKIRSAKICIVGLGGVGSWAAEACARSGIGSMSLVDLDDICVSNMNRQSHALTSTIGRRKCDVLAARVEEINPHCAITVHPVFFSEKTADRILSDTPTVVIDAIDRVTNKSLLIAECVKRGIPIVTTGSAGERTDPTAIRVADLAETIHDPLSSYVRKRLRQRFGFAKYGTAPFGVPCVFAPRQRNTEKRRRSAECGENSLPVKGGIGCANGLGSAVFVTGAFGFFAAAEAVKMVGR